MNFDFLSVLVVIGVAASIAYQVSFLHNRRLSYLSLAQIVNLIVVPGIIFPFLLNYMFAVMKRPLVATAFIPDSVLVVVTLLSLMFGYGGIAMHAVTKMIYKSALKANLDLDKHEFIKVNQFFHLTFSHNLIFSSILFSAIGGVLLETNHVPVTDRIGMMTAFLKGGMLGIAFLVGLWSYNPANDGYRGRWTDLKYMFMALWVGLVFLLYGLRKTRPSLHQYQLLLPVLVVLLMLFSLSLFLVIRATRSGKFGKHWKLLVRKVWP